MTRLYMTVEGQTEQAFASQVLVGHLASHGVFLHKPRLTGRKSRRRERIPQGGMRKFDTPLGDMKRWLKEDQSPDVRFTMMIDLYGLPGDFPRYEEGLSKNDAYERVLFLEDALRAEMADSRFIPYLQLHEFEALILSRPEMFGRIFDNRDPATATLRQLCGRFKSPELINHGETTHPSARIASVFPDYDKVVDGPLLATEIGLQAIRKVCPHFDRWLTSLENLRVNAD